MLEHFFTGYPFFMMRNEGLPREKVTNFPLLMTAYVALQRYGLLPKRAERPMNRWVHETLDAYVAANLPECDVVFALSSSGLRVGGSAQQQGGVVCDHGSTHIRYQDALLREEFRHWGMRFEGILSQGRRKSMRKRI